MNKKTKTTEYAYIVYDTYTTGMPFFKPRANGRYDTIVYTLLPRIHGYKLELNKSTKIYSIDDIVEDDVFIDISDTENVYQMLGVLDKSKKSGYKDYVLLNMTTDEIVIINGYEFSEYECLGLIKFKKSQKR